MKTLRFIVFTIIALMIVYSFQSTQKSIKKPSDIIGTYEYTGNQEGMSIWNENYFTWAFRIKPNKPDSILTLQDRNNSIYYAGGTWILKDSIVTCTYKYHNNPKLIGTSFRFAYDLKGNEFNVRFLNKDGKVYDRGFALKIK